mgnify:CR=1 FL=1
MPIHDCRCTPRTAQITSVALSALGLIAIIATIAGYPSNCGDIFSYDGDKWDIAINYVVLPATFCVLVLLPHRESDRLFAPRVQFWLPAALLALTFQLLLCVFYPCVGISICWAFFAGIILFHQQREW